MPTLIVGIAIGVLASFYLRRQTKRADTDPEMR